MISVIIPVYKVEPYLRKCLESVVNQTYADLEIIVVDDASPDRCGEICDEYALRDNRIRVFHNETNQGLSASRNIGLDNSRGNWVMFVDSDDWVEPEFCSIPLSAAESNDADLVIFRGGLLEKRKGKIKRLNRNRPEGLITREDAIEFGSMAAWNKLYKRDLFETIRYPKGRVYEDIATTHKLIYKANRIVMIPDILYLHIHRAGSISQTPSERAKRDGFISAYERNAFLIRHNCPFEKHQTALWNSTLGFLFRTVESASTDEDVRKAEIIVNSIQGYPKELKLRKRMMLMVWRIDKRLFHFICRLCGMKKR